MSETRSGIRMQFEKLLQQSPDAPELLLQGNAWGVAEHAVLLREVLGLANAAAKGPRYILFGVRRDDKNLSYLKLSDNELQLLEAYPDLVSRYVEPRLTVETIAGTANGHLLAALIITSCDNPPYIIKTDASRDLPRGSCWVREGGLCRPAQRADLDRIYQVSSKLQSVTVQSVVQLGIGADPVQKILTLSLPDASNPPSVQVAARLKKEIEAREAARQTNIEETGLARLMHARFYGNDKPFAGHGLDTLVQRYKTVVDNYGEQDNYYFFETQAIKLNFSVVNTSQVALLNVRISLTLPYADSFRIADQLYGPVDKPISRKESDLMGYPAVQRHPKAAQVVVNLSNLEPDSITPVLEQSLRIAVSPELAGKKVALRYLVEASGLVRPEEGTLKLTFRSAGH
jgi:hypothetical protein